MTTKTFNQKHKKIFDYFDKNNNNLSWAKFTRDECLRKCLTNPVNVKYYSKLIAGNAYRAHHIKYIKYSKYLVRVNWALQTMK